MAESNDPGEIARKDRTNGSWLFLASILVVPGMAAAWLTVIRSRSEAYEGFWAFLDPAWARIALASVVAVLCIALILWFVARARGGIRNVGWPSA
jgi:hypothetical protein